MQKSWMTDDKVKEGAVEMRSIGYPLSRIAAFIKNKGYRCSESNLCSWFKDKGIKPTSKIGEYPLDDKADLNTLKRAKITIKREMGRVEKTLRSNQNPDMKLLNDYLKLTENYRKLSDATRQLSSVFSTTNRQYSLLKDLIIQAEDEFPGLAEWVEIRMRRQSEVNEIGK